MKEFTEFNACIFDRLHTDRLAPGIQHKDDPELVRNAVLVACLQFPDLKLNENNINFIKSCLQTEATQYHDTWPQYVDLQDYIPVLAEIDQVLAQMARVRVTEANTI